MDLFAFSGEEWETYTVLDPLERANINYSSESKSVLTSSQEPGHYPSQIKPVQAAKSYFGKSYFNVSLPCIPMW